MKRTGIQNSCLPHRVVLDRQLMPDQDEVVLLLVEQASQDLAVIAMDRDDALAFALEVGDGPEAFDADAVPVTHQPHPVAVPVAPDKAARDRGGRRAA